MLTVQDEFNPSIVWKLNRQAQVINLTSSLYQDMVKELRKAKKEIPDKIQQGLDSCNDINTLIKDFIKKYDEAVDFVKAHSDGSLFLAQVEKSTSKKNWVPLAYKLNILTDEPADLKHDDIDAYKFGGYPDLRFNYSFTRSNTTSTLKKSIDSGWPKCGCCGRRMMFAGQFNITQEMAAIAAITEEIIGDGIGGMSGLGFHLSDTNALTGSHHLKQVFHCMCSDFENNSADFVVLNRYLFADGANRKFSDAAYHREIKKFAKENNVHPSDGHNLRFIKGFELGFDLEGEITQQSELSSLQDDFKEHFATKEPIIYTLFGRPTSQQNEKRPFETQSCVSGRVLRQMPILNFDTDSCGIGGDMTAQLYGSFRLPREHAPIFGKMEVSST